MTSLAEQLLQRNKINYFDTAEKDHSLKSTEKHSKIEVRPFEYTEATEYCVDRTAQKVNMYFIYRQSLLTMGVRRSENNRNSFFGLNL